MNDLDLKFLNSIINSYMDELRQLTQTRVPPELVDTATLRTMRAAMDDVLVALEDKGARRYLTALPADGKLIPLPPVDLMLLLRPYVDLLELELSSSRKSR